MDEVIAREEGEKAERNLQAKYGQNWKMSDISKEIEKLRSDGVEDNKRMLSIYGDIQAILKTYMDMSEYNYHIVTLWIIGTYVYEEFNSFPLLFINATKQSGKTRLMKLLEVLTWKGKIQANLSEAVLFRMKKFHTLLIDEFEQVKEKNTLREMINASYKKGAKVERMSKVKKEGKETYEVESFDLYSPLAMANIWGMDDVVEDRCIVIRLDRTNDKSKSLLLEDFNQNPQIKKVVTTLNEFKCRLCLSVGLNNAELTWNSWIMSGYNSTLQTLQTQPTQPTLLPIFNKIKETNINGRQLELFFPLIFIGNIFGQEMVDKTLELAKSNFEDKNADDFADNPDVALLDFLWKSYSENPYDYIFLIELANQFRLESPYQETPESLSRAMKRLNIILSKKRESKGRKVMLDFAKIKEKLERYKEVIEK